MNKIDLHWFMNTHQYPLDLVNKHTDECAFSMMKEEYIGKFSGKAKFYQEYNRKKYLITEYPVPSILTFMELFMDVDGKMKILPPYVQAEISEAIASINIYPSPIKMTVRDDHYVLYVKYTDELFQMIKCGGDTETDGNTTVVLEYTFDKSLRQFEGYFAKSIANECGLPDYEITETADKKEISMRITYKNNSVLNVKFKFETDSMSDLLLAKILDVPNSLKKTRINWTLLHAIVARLFPTRAHSYKVFLIDGLIKISELNFYNDMSLTPILWNKEENTDPNQIMTWQCWKSAINKNYEINTKKTSIIHEKFHRFSFEVFSQYILKCYSTKETRPIKCRLSNEDNIKAMNILIDEYPFFTNDEKLDEDICVYDVWRDYFKQDLTLEHASKMNLSPSVKDNLTKFWSSNPVKYEQISKLFPALVFSIMLRDFKQRLDSLRKVRPKDNKILNCEDVIYFNQRESSLPFRWRLYLWGGTIDEPAYLSGNDIIKRKENNIPPANFIEEINYLNIEYDEYSLSRFELMNQLSVSLTEDLHTLDPKHLEKKFQTYRFSNSYKTAPTYHDCLAVRFATVYKNDVYKVPEIPADFFDRFHTDSEDLDEDESKFNCVICTKRTKNHVFSGCKHVCLCELCSFQVLKCPLCCKAGNPQKIFQ